MKNFVIKKAKKKDAGTILTFIKKLADYENLSHQVTATEELLTESLFGPNAAAECAIGYYNNKPVCFALYFHNFSTFLGKPGLYLEDLFVLPEFRGNGFGKVMLTYLAKLAVERGCGRFEWAVLDWNEPALKFYKSLSAESHNEWIIHRVSGNALYKLAESNI
ncbi:acetyltransferase YpeA [bacterium BMS3Abin04]|nr:acetyltransferase YpeA [bacterium BMS3Abin04]